MVINLKAGELRHRITIQTLSATKDECGHPVGWDDVATVWAKVEDLSGREYFIAKQATATQVSTRITIRYRTDIKPEMRIVDGSRIFDIEAILDPDGRRRELQLMCQELV